MMPDDDVLTEPVARRVEVFTGAGRRRRWSPEAKARIVAESYCNSVGEVADRYGLAKTQLFTWRREARVPMEGGAGSMFTPVVLDPQPLPLATLAKPEPKPAKSRRGTRSCGIELEIDGVVMGVGRGAEVKTVAAVIQALKGAR